MDRRLIGLVLSWGVLAWFAAPAAAWDIVDCAVNCPPCQSRCNSEFTYGLPDNACFNNRWSALDLVYNGTDHVPTSGSADSLPVSSLDIAGIAASDLVALSDAQASAPGAGFRKIGNMRGAMTATDSAGPASTIAVLGSLGFIIMVIVISRLRG